MIITDTKKTGSKDWCSKTDIEGLWSHLETILRLFRCQAHKLCDKIHHMDPSLLVLAFVQGLFV